MLCTFGNHNEVYGALSHVRKPSPKTWEKVAETKKDDDGVLFSTSRNPDEVYGALSHVL